ncbi:MAG: ATP-binding protein, partial [Bacteroidota bacterium]
QIKELQTFINYGQTLMKDWGMSKKIKPGYRVLFHGPPGTGKTLTASLLGKYTGKDVYKIDLSMVVSKFIGETEKNLANLFAKAENKDWILFFDEADALFGKRTNVRDAHDKYANQEVSYLLQRVENYNGLVILASNFKSNMDDAFVRRFQNIIPFHLPDKKERLQLWTQGFPTEVELAADVDLKSIATKYDLSGASIINIIQFCCLTALSQDTNIIFRADIVKGIRREYSKEGRVLR